MHFEVRTAKRDFMGLYVLRLRNGNCVIAEAESEAASQERARGLGANSEVATVRALSSFAAHFVLSDEGELTAILLDAQTLADLRDHEYPMLKAAEGQSYADFGASQTDSSTDEVLYDRGALRHKEDWDTRDHQLVTFAVQQERLRLSN